MRGDRPFVFTNLRTGEGVDIDGALIAFTGCIIHYTDVGGMVPGSNPQRATELYQEGIVLPPMKLAEGGRPNDTLRKLIAANVRNPEIFFGDLHAQEAALATGERRVLALVERFGIEPIRAAMATLIALTEDKARAEIAAMQRGSYVFEDFMDHDGIDLDRPVGIRVRLDVLPDRLRFDFTGTDPQVKGPLNAPLSKTWTTVFYCVMCALSDDVTFNDGLANVIEIHVPEGTVLNPRHPAPVNARSVTVNRVADVVLGALAFAVPGRLGAQSCGVPTGVSFGGVDPNTGRNFVFYESYCGGMGATVDGDGADADQHRHVERHEHSGRGDRDRLSDPHQPLRDRARHRRQRSPSRRARAHPRVRDARRGLRHQRARRPREVRAARDGGWSRRCEEPLRPVRSRDARGPRGSEQIQRPESGAATDCA